MAERTARLGSMHYQDADGRYRTASAGDTIKVHPDDVERFDRFNVLAGESPVEKEKPQEAAPKRRGRPSKDESEGS